MRSFLILTIFTLGSCIDRPKPAKPIVVEHIQVEDTRQIDKGDLSYFRITFLEKGYEVSIFNKSLKTDNIHSIDKFMNEHKGIIDKEKIAIRGLKPHSAQLQKLIPVLKKYNVEKFRTENT